MDRLSQLQDHSDEIATAVSTIAHHVRHAGDRSHPTTYEYEPPTTAAHPKIHRAEGSILSRSAQLKTLVRGPTDFLEHLASQNAILAGLQWLCHSQILACIPSPTPPPPHSHPQPRGADADAVPLQEIAELAGVALPLLQRIVRLLATAGFLHEPQPGRVAHTRLSAAFVANPALLDTAVFLAETIAPATLQTTTTASDPLRPEITTTTSASPRVRRQWGAYLQYAAGVRGAADDADGEILAQFNWATIGGGGGGGARAGTARVVAVGAGSTTVACALAALHPSLRFVVQLSGSASGGAHDVSARHGHVVATHRVPGSPQPALDAAVYVLHMPTTPTPTPTPTRPASPAAQASMVLAELHAHLPALRASHGVMLVLTPRLLPEPGSLADPEIEATTRARDLAMFRLANDGEMEMATLLDMVPTVTDDAGKLVVASQLPARNNSNLVVALLLKYQFDMDANSLFT